MTAAPFTTPTLADGEMAEFMAALETRRNQVYDFLDHWGRQSAFKPADIHDAIYSYIRRRGKALRPLVLLLACGAVGGDEEQAIPAAAAVEVFHTWTLVHDDIIDRDATRRGQPTVHAEYAEHGRAVFGLAEGGATHYGTAVAILAGDSQQSWAYALLSDLTNRGVAPGLILELVERMASWLTPQLLEGEMLDVQYSLAQLDTLTEADVLGMLTKKTGALLEYAAWCGARIGLGPNPGDTEVASRLGRFASLCGTAFQLHDDVLGLTADEAALGKPVGSDLREGKRTLLVYRALSKAAEGERAQLLAALGKPDATAREISDAIQIIKSTGALDEISDLANIHISQAIAILDTLPDTQERRLLASWAGFLLSRRH